MTVAFVLFRSDSFAQGGAIIAQMFTGWHFEYACVELAMRQLTPLFIIAFTVAIVAATPIKGAIEQRIEAASDSTAMVLEIASYVLAIALLVLSLLALSGGGYNPFIYFRF